MTPFHHYCARLAHYIADNSEFSGNLFRYDIVAHYTRLLCNECANEQDAYTLAQEIVSCPINACIDTPIEDIIMQEKTPSRKNTLQKLSHREFVSLQAFVERDYNRKRRSINYNSGVTRAAFYHGQQRIVRTFGNKCYAAR